MKYSGIPYMNWILLKFLKNSLVIYMFFLFQIWSEHNNYAIYTYFADQKNQMIANFASELLLHSENNP